MGKETTRTYGTRKEMLLVNDEALKAFASYSSMVTHRLFADIASGKKPNSLKNEYLKRYKITARHFNGIKVSLEGKISSIKVRQASIITEKRDRILSLEKKVQNLVKKNKNSEIIHQKKRRLDRLQHELQFLEDDKKNGIVRLCFGSKKLFRKQFDLDANGYFDHKEWSKDWNKARSSELFFLGSKDETSGNQSCTATINEDKTLSLRIRLPDSLTSQFGKHIVIDKVFFKYGMEELLTALTNNQAICWRFIHDEKGWRIFATFDITPPSCTSKVELGVIGLDINVDHLALVNIDRFGNPLESQTIPFYLKNKSSEQVKAIIGDAVKKAVSFAKAEGKSLIIEELDFQKKKASIREETSPSLARTLSSFAYQSVISHIKSNALKNGVLVKQVNPAYTSLIGRVKFAIRYGLTIHQAAALTIGRRFLGCSEKPPHATVEIPDGKSNRVTLTLPVRNRAKHVWSFWRELNKKIPVALRAHFRTEKSRSSSTVKTAPETFSEVVGEIPIYESSELLFC